MAEPSPPAPPQPGRYAVTFTVIVESVSAADAGRRGWYLLTTPQPPGYRFPVLAVTGDDGQVTIVDLNTDQAAPPSPPGDVPRADHEEAQA